MTVRQLALVVLSVVVVVAVLARRGHWGPNQPAERSTSMLGHSAWERLASSSGYAHHSLVAFGGRLYAVGGVRDGYAGNRPAAFEMYEPDSDAWTALSPLPEPRNFAGSAVAGGKLYVIGGVAMRGLPDGQQPAMSSVNVYSFETNAWSTGPPLTVARSRLATVALHGSVYAIGGFGPGNLAIVERLDPGASEWVPVAPLQLPRHGHAAVVVGGRLLVLGGYAPQPTGSVEEYDPIANKWRRRAQMPTPRGFFGAAVVNGHVFAIAGRVKGPPPIERYDPVSDTWESKGVAPGPLRNRFGTAALNGAIYINGGEAQGSGDISRDLLRFTPNGTPHNTAMHLPERADQGRGSRVRVGPLCR